jgi:hypothetical protein
MVRTKKLAQKNQHTVMFIHLQPAVRNVVRIARLETLPLQAGD